MKYLLTILAVLSVVGTLRISATFEELQASGGNVLSGSSQLNRIKRKPSSYQRSTSTNTQSQPVHTNIRSKSSGERRNTQTGVSSQSPESNRFVDLPPESNTIGTASTSVASNDNDGTNDGRLVSRSRLESVEATSPHTQARPRHSGNDIVNEPDYYETSNSANTCEIREQQSWIVDIQSSFSNGAQALHKTNTTYEECITSCCATKHCNTVVFESGTVRNAQSNRQRAAAVRSSTCYLLNCGNLDEKRCVLSAHPEYTTVQLSTAFRPLGERCNTKTAVFCRDYKAECSKSNECECISGYVKQYNRCVEHRCGTDEFQCWSPPNVTDTQSPPVCIASYNRCDSRHIQQCPDGSDEFDCPEVDETTSSYSRSDSKNHGASKLKKTTAVHSPVSSPVVTQKAVQQGVPSSQLLDSTFGANVTQLWNVHAILSGLFEHRGAQLDDSSVSEQNALIVAIVLLVAGLVMTSILIALVACNLRRLLGLSKRRYARRSASGDAERLVNGLNL